MKLFYPAIALLLILPANFVQASGWVKDSGKYYVKGESSQAGSRRFEQPEYKFDQVEQTTALYGEYGLNAGRPLQLSVYTSFKSIKRRDPEVRDSFVAKGFTDTDLMGKVQLHEWSLANGNAGKILLAGALGVTMPTTKKKRSAGHEAEQAPELPETRRFLISSVDRGRPAASAGLGTSYFYQFFWTNVGYTYKNGTNANWYQSQADLALGFSLPYNCWLQISTSQLVSQDKDKAAGSAMQSEKSMLSTQSVSLGLNFWQGLALEPRYERAVSSDSRWEANKSFALGLSVRT